MSYFHPVWLRTQAAEGDEGDVRPEIEHHAGQGKVIRDHLQSDWSVQVTEPSFWRAHGKANAQVGVQDIRDTKEHAHKLEVAYRIRAGHAQDARNQVGRESATYIGLLSNGRQAGLNIQNLRPKRRGDLGMVDLSTDLLHSLHQDCFNGTTPDTKQQEVSHQPWLWEVILQQATSVACGYPSLRLEIVDCSMSLLGLRDYQIYWKSHLWWKLQNRTL